MRVDQWCVYFVGAILGMMLPALLYVTFLPAGSDIRGLGIAAALAQAVATKKQELSLAVLLQFWASGYYSRPSWTFSRA